MVFSGNPEGIQIRQGLEGQSALAEISPYGFVNFHQLTLAPNCGLYRFPQFLDVCPIRALNPNGNSYHPATIHLGWSQIGCAAVVYASHPRLGMSFQLIFI